ncbi:hypothetical protein GF351_01485 [Candidatus Woesearchaeota archaeon]|nr:hypothetical protein [Candidatus Woesearchaeota archaeon]
MAHSKHTIRRSNDDGLSLELHVGVHPSKDGKIVAYCPGMSSDLDGHKGMNLKLADHIQSKGIGAVVRGDCRYHTKPRKKEEIVDNFRALLDFALDNAESICGLPIPSLYLMGYSAGAGAAAAIADEYPVEKLLMIAPAGNAGHCILDGLLNFQGELYIVKAQDDDVVRDCPERFYKHAISALKKELRIVPDCSHGFAGDRNERTFTNSPLWAFSGNGHVLGPEGGVRLYEP